MAGIPLGKDVFRLYTDGEEHVEALYERMRAGDTSPKLTGMRALRVRIGSERKAPAEVGASTRKRKYVFCQCSRLFFFWTRYLEVTGLVFCCI